MKELKAILQPFCDQGLTPRDLVEQCTNHFRKLASHAISNPEDFVTYARTEFSYALSPDNVIPHTDISELSEVLGKSASSIDPTLIERLDQAEQAICDKTRHTYFEAFERRQAENWRAEELQKETDHQRWLDDLAQQHAKIETQIEKGRHTPSLRSEHSVTLIPGEERGQFFVRPEQRNQSLPTRADWLHWAQERDPAATPADVKVTNHGLMLTFQQTAMIDELHQAAVEQGGWATIALPNRRQGVDLNHPTFTDPFPDKA